LIKQGAKLTATWDDIWEELPSEIQQKLQQEHALATEVPVTASLFGDAELPPHERKILSILKQDESTQIDEIVERLEGQISSSEVFAALFELELSGKIKQMPGKNFVKSF
jgi:DNA processing protein